ncbi:hypothetical protein D3C72_2350870 [compost metagenome]
MACREAMKTTSVSSRIHKETTESAISSDWSQSAANSAAMSVWRSKALDHLRRWGPSTKVWSGLRIKRPSWTRVVQSP